MRGNIKENEFYGLIRNITYRYGTTLFKNDIRIYMPLYSR